MILAIETATNICSVCLQDDAGKVHEKRTERKGSHSELLFLFVRELMKEHSFKMGDLDSVLVSIGPGSYTGLRIAASAVKGMLFGLEVNVYAANTLAGFARSVEKGNIHAVINARRKHLYHQEFKKDKVLSVVSESQILEISEIEQKLSSGDYIIGTGMERLNAKKLEGVKIMDSAAITSKSLILLFTGDEKEHFFVKTTAEELESNYLSSSQVNNTSL